MEKMHNKAFQNLQDNEALQIIKSQNWTPEKVEAFNKMKVQKELTPELADKIWKSMQRRFYNERVSKEHVLHHLKQLKAQIGKIRKQTGYQNQCTQNAFDSAFAAIDDKIAKIN